MHVDAAIILYLSIREGDRTEIQKLMEGMRPAVEEALKQLGLTCGALVLKKMATLRTKIPEDKWNESLLIAKHGIHLSPIAHANGPFDRQDSTLHQAWAGDENAFQKDSKFCTFLVALLTQKN